MSTEHASRFLPCHILQQGNIPCVIWCEDAVGHYGVPTVVFDLHLLVSDIDIAAKALTQRGWRLQDSSQTQFGNISLNSAHRRLMPPVHLIREPPRWLDRSKPPPLPSQLPPGPTTTILLPAREWNFTLSPTCQSLYPSLPALADGLISKLLDDELTDGIWHHLNVLIAYLYLYVPALKDRCFAEDLKYENRQYHYDCLSGMSTGLPFIRHERRIRDALREGGFQLCDCSADESDESLFDAKVMARLRALMPVPFTPEEYEADKQREIEEERRLWEEELSEEARRLGSPPATEG